MGIEYILYKPAKKEIFELGKGRWSSLFRIENPFTINEIVLEKTWPVVELYRLILYNVAWTFNENMNLKYFRNLADNICFWCSKDLIEFWDEESFNDTYFDIRKESFDQFRKRIPITGTRYNKTGWVFYAED